MEKITRREAILTTAASASLAAQTSPEIIDVHLHAEPTPATRMWPRSIELVLSDMDRCGVRAGVFSPFRGVVALREDDLPRAHDEALEMVAKAPKRLAAYIVVQPHLTPATLKREIARAVTAGFAGIKLHGAVHNYPADGPSYRMAYEFAEQHSLTVLFHTGPQADKVPEIARRYPNMKLMLAHLGGTQESALRAAREIPNLYLDTCGSSMPYRFMERAVRIAGAGKLLYGSDSSYLAMGGQVAKLTYARIEPEERLRILGGNARALFGKRLPGT